MVSKPEKLLVILRHHGKILGRKRFQKIVFLLEKKYNLDLKYNFISHLFGPYSKKLQLDIDLLNSMGLINVRPGAPYSHVLTEKGAKKAEEIEKRMNSEEMKAFKIANEELEKVSTTDLTREAKSIKK